VGGVTCGQPRHAPELFFCTGEASLARAASRFSLAHFHLSLCPVPGAWDIGRQPRHARNCFYAPASLRSAGAAFAEWIGFHTRL